MRAHHSTSALFMLAGLTIQLAFPPNSLANIQIDKILVTKHNSRLLLLSNGKIIKEYKIALGRKSGPKVHQGDNKTPEGSYIIDRHSLKSRFYKALHISYPSSDDLALARKSSVPAGGDIMIHGLPKGFEDLGSVHSTRNWTKGCIAVSNAEIDEIWQLVADGTPIQIVP